MILPLDGGRGQPVSYDVKGAVVCSSCSRSMRMTVPSRLAQRMPEHATRPRSRQSGPQCVQALLLITNRPAAPLGESPIGAAGAADRHGRAGAGAEHAALAAGLNGSGAELYTF